MFSEVISLHVACVILYCTLTNKTRQMVLVLHNDTLPCWILFFASNLSLTLSSQE